MNHMKLTPLLFFLMIIPFVGTTQINEKKLPYSSTYHINSEIPFFNLQAVDNDSLIKINNQLNGSKVLHFATMIDVKFDIKQLGECTKFDKGRIWQLGVVSSGAHSLYTEFINFNLPDGARLFLYNPDKSHVLGAFTNKNNKTNSKLAILPVIGDSLIVEYFEPFEVQTSTALVLERIGHDYIGVVQFLDEPKDESFGDSGDCNYDINCFEGNNWQREKHAVCRIIANGALCSGALVNNTNHDARPLFLTANHCVSNQTIADNMICVFNYESPDCKGIDGSVEQAISGGTVRATSPLIDFCLIELSSPPLPSFQPYFAGWDRSDQQARQTTGIHHPQGDVKKISIDFDPPTSDDYPPYLPNTHWHVHDWDKGTTEGGSSGSPLFNQDHRIIGDLTGGEASCTFNYNDYYSKFSSAWDTYPESNSQLKYWLDPANTGAETLNGYDPYWGQNKPVAVFSGNRTNVLEGGTVDFTDLSEGNVTSWQWHFAGASPSSSNEQHPADIRYTYPGIFPVRLIVTNNHGSHEIILNDYINVQENCGDFSNIEENEDLFLFTFAEGEWGYWTGHNQYTFSGFAERYSNQSGRFVHGIYIVPAVAYASYPSAVITAKIWEGGPTPGSVLRESVQYISAFTPGVWEYISFDPAVETNGNFYAGFEINYGTPDTFAVPHSYLDGPNGENTAYIKRMNIWNPINAYSPDMTISLCIDAHLCTSLNNIEAVNNPANFNVFPNPANSYLVVDLHDTVANSANLQIVSLTGQTVFSKKLNSDLDQIKIDISKLTPGMYSIMIQTERSLQVARFIKVKQ